MSVGEPHRPEAAGYGGLGLGVPRPPWMEAIRAVSSPHTKAPAPMRTSTWKSKAVPKMSSAEQARSLGLADALVSAA